MEARGVEPLSENPSAKTSSIIVGYQNSSFSSFRIAKTECYAFAGLLSGTL